MAFWFTLLLCAHSLAHNTVLTEVAVGASSSSLWLECTGPSVPVSCLSYIGLEDLITYQYSFWDIVLLKILTNNWWVVWKMVKTWKVLLCIKVKICLYKKLLPTWLSPFKCWTSGLFVWIDTDKRHVLDFNAFMAIVCSQVLLCFCPKTIYLLRSRFRVIDNWQPPWHFNLGCELHHFHVG